MTNKLINLAKERPKRKPRTPEESARLARRLFIDKIPEDLVEPDSLASGGDMPKILEQKKPLSLDDVARIAALDLFNPGRAQLEEPVGLASGKTFTGGSFVSVTQAEILADREVDDIE